MPRGKGWIWPAERLEELIRVMKEDSDAYDADAGTFTFRGASGLARRLVKPYDKVDDTVTIGMIDLGLQLLQELDMLEPGRSGTLPPGYERKFTPRPITGAMIAHLKMWRATQR